MCNSIATPKAEQCVRAKGSSASLLFLVGKMIWHFVFFTRACLSSYLFSFPLSRSVASPIHFPSILDLIVLTLACALALVDPGVDF